MTARLLLTLVTTLLLAGCVIPGMGPDPGIALREAEADAKAIGGACRHGLRSIEDCYSLNEEESKAAVFEGWKDMGQYMRKNKIEGVRAAIAKSEPVEVLLEDKGAKAVAADKAPAKANGKDATASAH